MNSDLTPSQSADATGNPQAVDGSVGAPDAGSFQRSAGIDSLNQNRPLSVAQTGQPIVATPVKGSSLALMWVFIVVSSVVLIMIASAVFKWVMKRPEPKKEKAVKPAAKAPKVEVIRPRGKKKQSRSKRHK